jgi:hypothetical protein
MGIYAARLSQSFARAAATPPSHATLHCGVQAFEILPRELPRVQNGGRQKADWQRKAAHGDEAPRGENAMASGTGLAAMPAVRSNVGRSPRSKYNLLVLALPGYQRDGHGRRSSRF